MPLRLKPWQLAPFFLLATGMPASAQPEPTAATDSYRINPGDQVEVYVWGDERLQRSIRVLPDGSFTFPLVGRLVVQGKRTTDVEADISAALAPQYNGEPPQVTVSVQQPTGYSYSIIGRVRSPGNFTPMRYVNVLEALAAAGGPDEFASLDNVTIIRKTEQGVTAIRVRLGGAMKGNVSNANEIPQLQVGDTVIVP
ncbi:MAG TPA: polysaccharide biosynthesis/export family protein [Sphingobium sp.]|nr:polysaccharide biosynthesis/export family protein [Sphingobium sp.]